MSGAGWVNGLALADRQSGIVMPCHDLSTLQTPASKFSLPALPLPCANHFVSDDSSSNSLRAFPYRNCRLHVLSPNFFQRVCVACDFGQSLPDQWLKRRLFSLTANPLLYQNSRNPRLLEMRGVSAIMWPALAALLACYMPIAAGIDLWEVTDEDVMPTSLFLSVSNRQPESLAPSNSPGAASGDQSTRPRHHHL